MTDNAASPGADAPAPRRRWRRFAVAAAALLVIAGAALWFSRLTLAERAGRDLLARFGLDEAELVVVELTPGHIVLADIIVGPGEALAIDRLEATFDPAGLIAGRIDGIVVDGLRIHGSLDGQRLSLGPFDDVREATAGLGESGDGDAALVVPPVRLSGLEVFLESPLGPLTLQAGGEMGTGPDGDFLTEATIRIVAPGGFLDGTLTARRTPAGEVSATVGVASGEIALAGALIGGLAGRLEFTRGLDDPLPVLDGALRADAVSLAGGPPLPVDLLLDFDGDRLGFTASVATPDGASRIDVAGEVQPLATPLASGFTVTLESANLSGLAAWLGLTAEGAVLPAGAAQANAVVRLSGSPARMTGEVRLTGEVADVVLPGIGADGAILDIVASIETTPDNIVIVLDEGGTVRLTGVRPQAVETPVPAELVLVPAAGGRVALDLARPEAPDWEVGFRADPAPIELSLPGDGAPLRLPASLPGLEISGAGSGPDGRWTVSGSGGSLEIPAHEVRLDNLDIRATWPPEVTDGAPETLALLQITGGRLRHTASPAWLPPLDLDGVLYETASGYRFEGRARGPGGTPAFAIAADHDPEAGTGSATIGMAPVALGGGGAAPEDLSPILAGIITEVSGSLDSEVRLVWGEAGLAGQIEILVGDLSATIADARLERINTVLVFDNLVAGDAPDLQEVAIGAMDIGIPLQDGRILLALDADGRLRVESMTWRLAGGEVRADDFVLDPRADLQAFILDVEGVGLGELMAIFALEGLEAEGVLDGRIPITVVGGELEIYQAELTTRGPGHVRYRPESYPLALDTQGAAVALLLQAVENFEYESLRLTVDRESDGEAGIGLHLVGSNPDLHDGYPVNLNVTLSGQLDSIVREGLQSWRVPDEIRRRMEQFSR